MYFRQGHSEVFNLIHEKKLYSALLDNLIPLMVVNTKVQLAYWLLNWECKYGLNNPRLLSISLVPSSFYAPREREKGSGNRAYPACPHLGISNYGM